MSKESKKVTTVVKADSKHGVLEGSYKNQFNRFEQTTIGIGANIGWQENEVRLCNSEGYNILTFRAKELPVLQDMLTAFKTSKEYKTALELDKKVSKEVTQSSKESKALKAENSLLKQQLAALNTKYDEILLSIKGKSSPAEKEELDNTSDDINKLFELFMKKTK